MAFSDILGFGPGFGGCGLGLGLEGCGLDAICCLSDKCSATDPIPTRPETDFRSDCAIYDVAV